MSTLHVLWRDPTKVIKRDREDPRWCFICRKRLGGEWTLRADVEPSYYEPNWSYHCDGGKHDGRYFPGRGPA